MSGNQQHIPPATFEFLVQSLKFQVEVQLGVHEFGDRKEEPELTLARHTIDLLAVIQDKTKGNLSTEEQRLLENSLTECRFRYVQAVNEEAHKKAEAATKASDKPDA